MTISFVVPAYNEEILVGKCIESIQRELERGQYEAEIIVVNNASTDRTRDIASSFKGVRVVDEPRKGLVRAREAGFRASTGELIANIDADVMLPPGWLSTVLTAFATDEKLVALSGPFIYYDAPPITQVLVKFFYGLAYLMYCFNRFVLSVGSMVQGGNFVLRRGALQHIGGFDTSIEFYGEDTDIAKRLHPVGRVRWTFRLPAYTSSRRLAGEGIVSLSFRYSLNYLSVLFMGKPFTRHYRDHRPGSDHDTIPT